MSETVGDCAEEDAVFDAFDPFKAVDFLESRACDLRHAMARPDRPDAIAALRDRQAASHEGWLSLIGVLDRVAGAYVAEQVAGLYGFHGRVAACLERGLDPRLGPQVAVRVRVQLLAELQARTGATVAAVLEQTSAAGHPS